MDIAGYTVIKPLGRNALSTVYLAKHAKVKGRYVIRHLAQEAADDAEIASAFLQGVNHATEIIHPQLVRVYQYGQHMGRPFCIMEHVVGDTLTKKRESMCLLDKIYVVKQAARALAYLAKFNLPHLNVNPFNIYLKKGDTSIVLAGFGFDPMLGLLTSDADESHIKAAHFLSPEQLDGSTPDLRSDIFSLGAVFLWLLTGNTPVRAASVTGLKASVQNEGIPVIELPEKLQIFGSILARMLEQDPAERASMTQVLDALESFGDEDILAADSPEETDEEVAATTTEEEFADLTLGSESSDTISALSTSSAMGGATSGEFATSARTRSANVVSLDNRRSSGSRGADDLSGHELSELLEEHPEIFEGPKANEKPQRLKVIKNQPKGDVRAPSRTSADAKPDLAARADKSKDEKLAVPNQPAKQATAESETGKKATFSARAPSEPPRAARDRRKKPNAVRPRNPATATRVAPDQELSTQHRRQKQQRPVWLASLYLFVILAPIALGIALILATPDMQQQVFNDYILPAREYLRSFR